MADISLSKSVRSNLLSLKGTADMMASTQNRLATGNKVNSALDNPSSWFTAQGLTNRASDLGSLLDSMANGVKTLEAADNGLTAMTKTLESMQSTLRQARQDKSFQTASFETNKNLTTGSLTFSKGAVGNVGRSVDLANEDLTEGALGMGSDVTEDVGTGAAAASAGVASITFGAGGILETGDSLAMTFEIDGADQAITITGADVAGATGGGSNLTADKMREILAEKLTGVTIGGSGTEITITSATTGADSDVNMAAAAVLTNTSGDSTVTDASIGLDAAIDGTVGEDLGTAAANTITWGGDPLEMNQNAKISFTATIDGKEQTIELTQDDVLKAGNGDNIIDDADEFAAILGSKIEGVSVAASGDAITITSSTFGTDSKVELGAATVSGIAYTADELVQSINSNDSLKGFIRASNDNGKLRIENQSTQKLEITGASGGKITGAALAASDIAGNSVRAGLADQFNELRDQLDKLADDASFNGINLLRGDKLAITFNETGTSAIDIQTEGGETINSANLGVATTLEASDLDSDTTIDTELSKLKSALNEVRSQASSFGSNLSIVENRQKFTDSMINTLEAGAGNLTLADMNTEAANLLALQTRQSLSQNSLSLASQADQSILQLIR